MPGAGQARPMASGGYFGSAPCCYGVLHQPHSPSAPRVVIVNDFGTRALSAYWTFRRLAERLSEAGHPVLRFDFPGTGDSPAISGNRVDCWQRSVERAI